MNLTKKLDRAFQWAGEKMGGEQHTTMSDEFKALEVEMAQRSKGMEKLQRSMSSYVRWLSQKGDGYGSDKDKGTPTWCLGRVMTTHGDEFEPDSEFGGCLIVMGKVNNRLSSLQENYAANATSSWLQSLERSLAMMKEYQAARKKLDSRRLAYDASMAKINKAKRDDFRQEEELRGNKAKYEETSEDVLRRMLDIKEAEKENISDLSLFLEAELEYHERCAEELRRVKQMWRAGLIANRSPTAGREPGGLSRVDATSPSHATAHLRPRSHNIAHDGDREPTPEPMSMPVRSASRLSVISTTSSSNPSELQIKSSLSRTSNFQPERRPAPPTPQASPANSATCFRGQLRSVNPPVNSLSRCHDNVFGAEHNSPLSSAGSLEWGDGVESPATSVGSGTSLVEKKKAPPPPPPSRGKRLPPPIPARRQDIY